MTLEAFEKLYDAFALAHAGRLANLTVTKRKGTPRRRAVGAGGKHRYSLRDRLLMTLFWLRVYTTYEVMGFFYERIVAGLVNRRIRRKALESLRSCGSLKDDRLESWRAGQFDRKHVSPTIAPQV